MNKIKYETPNFDFNEMKLTENIAATCWGYAYAWYDADSDGKIDYDTGEKVILGDIGLGENGCQGDSARKALINYFIEKFNITLGKEEVSTATDSQTVKPSDTWS